MYISDHLEQFAEVRLNYKSQDKATFTTINKKTVTQFQTNNKCLHFFVYGGRGIMTVGQTVSKWFA